MDESTKNQVTRQINIERVNPHPYQGLNQEQVKARFHANAYNKKVESATKSAKDIVVSNVCTYFNAVFLILGVLLAIVQAYKNMLFLGVIIANTLIGIVQELRSKKVLDRLAMTHAPHTNVVREGNIYTVDAEKLVLDDIILLEAGAQIPADAIVVEGTISVNESLLTGESDEIIKNPGDELMSGSFVVSGKAYCRLEKVGADSYMSKLTIQATKSKKGEQSEMIRALNRLILVMGILIIPIGVALFVQSYFINEVSFEDSIVSMVAAVIGMIPEGLYLLASVAMALSAMRLAKREVMIHDMKCIETLARVDVLCVDKTGTITEPGMQVYGFEPCLLGDGDEEMVKADLKTKLSDFAAALPTDNETMRALQASFQSTSGKRATNISTFSSETKYSGVAFADATYVIGAPEFVMREDLKLISGQIEEFSKQGFRVLVFGEYKGELDGKKLTGKVKPLGIVMLSNPIRSGAKDTFTYFAERDVEIKVISGDNPLTVSVIAKEAGIANAERYVDASTLKSNDDILQAVDRYTVFGRVTPSQKKALVLALKAKKHTVAMTGDGVNDILALKEADCSIAMASGSEAASNVAQLVLLDSDFAKMPSVVMEGRRVVNNIERTASLYVVKNIFSMLLAIFSVLLLLDYPLEPTQISLISMFTIGAPSFVLSLEPNKNSIRGHFLTNVFLKALPAGVTDFLVVSGLVLFCREFDVDLECLSTSCTVLLGIVGFMILYKISKPMNWIHITMMVVVILGFLYGMFFMSDFFSITAITKQCAMLTFVFAVMTEPILRYLSLAADSLNEWILQKDKKLKKR
ncbi:MAG: HAD family hydrolase [Lachnospiraceae bacterium]|nr:HAD family hydrolase [Lachnospiraceae bacterium]